MSASSTPASLHRLSVGGRMMVSGLTSPTIALVAMSSSLSLLCAAALAAAMLSACLTAAISAARPSFP
eukprot:895712-Ditylum_brightwellii.AAC.1